MNLIIEHFEYLAQKKSNAKNYYQGIDVTKKWIELTTKANIEQDRLDKIIQLIKNESIPDTPWYDLWLEVKNLREKQHLNISPHNPWYEGLEQTRCISEADKTERNPLGHKVSSPKKRASLA